PPIPTLLPYTTLFRSETQQSDHPGGDPHVGGGGHVQRVGGEPGDEDDDDLDRERCSVEQLEIRTGVDLTLRSIHACRLPQFILTTLPRRHLPAATQRRPGRARPPPRLRPAGHGARCGPGSPPPAPRAF